jgi:DNA-binding NarL/FixJ family response regulator
VITLRGGGKWDCAPIDSAPVRVEIEEDRSARPGSGPSTTRSARLRVQTVFAEEARPHVVVLEPQLLLRDALRCLLNAAGFAADAESGLPYAELEATLRARQPDVVVLAIDPAVEASVELLRHLPAIAEAWRTLVLTASDHPALHAQVIELGAKGVVTREQPGEVLVKAISKINAGELWLDRARAAAVITRLARGQSTADDPERTNISALTKREREIVDLVAEGLRNRDIAKRLSISEATVRNHLTSVLDKLDLHDRFQLAVFAFRKGLVSCPQTSAMLRISAPWKR